MSLANPDQASGNAAKIDSRFAFESHVGRAQHNAGKQFPVLRGIPAEPVHDFLALCSKCISRRAAACKAATK